MSKRLEITETFIRALAKSSAQRRKALLRTASKDELYGLFELCLNIIRGNLPLNKAALHRLRHHRKAIEDLSSRRISLQKKKRIINQKGGFLAPLAQIALPLLAHLVMSRRK